MGKKGNYAVATSLKADRITCLGFAWGWGSVAIRILNGSDDGQVSYSGKNGKICPLQLVCTDESGKIDRTYSASLQGTSVLQEKCKTQMAVLYQKVKSDEHHYGTNPT